MKKNKTWDGDGVLSVLGGYANLQDISGREMGRIACRGSLSVQFKGSFEGFRLVLIGDLHEQPLLHLRVKPFILGAKDWSGEVSPFELLQRAPSYS